ncbi:MAG: DUF1175 family protein [Myxococcota bacterium]
MRWARAFIILPLLALAPGPTSEALLRQEVGAVALRQWQQMDTRWHPQQRDCAGLVRFAYRESFQRFAASSEPLWRDGTGRKVPFADAETLLRHNFVFLGRDEATQETLRTGDLLAFRQVASGVDAFAAPFHLMIVVRPTGADRHQLLVVYHSGDPEKGMRAGALRNLVRDAPREWIPSADNPSFLGFYRFKEWSHE